jgi:hypothetical protein
MVAIPYDPTLDSLSNPWKANDFFTCGTFAHGQIPSLEALCVEMSRVAYVKEVDRLEEYLKRVNFRLVEAVGYDQRYGTQFFIAEMSTGGDRPTAVVAFRGTEPGDYMDIATDANVRKDSWAGRGKVHIGFRDAAPKVDTLKAKLAPVVESKAYVLFTGHSLGAALAILAAAVCSPDYICTFGGPRVGDIEFANNLQQIKHDRYQNCHDLVCRMPAEKMGYKHTGRLRYIDRRGQLQDPTPSHSDMVKDQGLAVAEYPRVLAQYKARHLFDLSVLLPTRDLADHTLINYLSGVMGLRH